MSPTLLLGVSLASIIANAAKPQFMPKTPLSAWLTHGTPSTQIVFRPDPIHDDELDSCGRTVARASDWVSAPAKSPIRSNRLSGAGFPTAFACGPSNGRELPT